MPRPRGILPQEAAGDDGDTTPASGGAGGDSRLRKTTYAHRLLARCPTLRLISPDRVREELYPGYADGQIDHRLINHRRIFQLAYRRTAEALAAGHDVLFDATSLTPPRRRRLITLGQRYDALLVARYFAIPLRLALHRNNLRARQVPPGIIAHMATMLVPPTRAEGFARVVVMHLA